MTEKVISAKTARFVWTPASAKALMQQANFEPLDPYPGKASLKWRCLCLRCGKESTPRPTRIRGGHGCYFCGRLAVSAARRTPQPEAIAEMQAAGVNPIEPYPDAENPWLCRCQSCGREVRPRLANVRRGWGGCRFCARPGGRVRLDEEKAVRDMLAVGLEPLEPYRSSKVQWLCRCLSCGRNVKPRYGNIRLGRGGCTHCARHQFDRVGPALVYAFEHRDLRAVKIGVTSDMTRGRRLGELKGGGWRLLKTWLCTPGERALSVERSVLFLLRSQYGSQPFLGPESMPMGGHTETFDALVAEPSGLVQIIDAAYKAAGVANESSG